MLFHAATASALHNSFSFLYPHYVDTVGGGKSKSVKSAVTSTRKHDSQRKHKEAAVPSTQPSKQSRMESSDSRRTSPRHPPRVDYYPSSSRRQQFPDPVVLHNRYVRQSSDGGGGGGEVSQSQLSALTQTQAVESPEILSPIDERGEVENSQPLLAQKLRNTRNFPNLDEDSEEVAFENHNDPLVDEHGNPIEDKSVDGDKSYDSEDSDSSEGDKSTAPPSAFDPYDECFAESVADYPLIQRIKHYMRNRLVTQSNRRPVEISLLAEAAKIVIGEGDMSTEEQGKLLIRTYLDLVESLPDDMFASLTVKTEMLDRMKGMQTSLVPSVGANLFKKYKIMRKEIRLIFSGLGTEFSTMKSGKQLYDVYRDYIVGTFVKLHSPLYDKKDVRDVIKKMPTDYWLHHKD
eukprot:scaffold85426_cov23-Cyclotella_meneghiniana.AAC.4